MLALLNFSFSGKLVWPRAAPQAGSAEAEPRATAGPP